LESTCRYCHDECRKHGCDFTPTAAALSASTNYTATISTAAKNAGSITAMPNPVAWSFTTMGASSANQATPFIGQAPVNLLSSANFVILAQTQITEANPVVARSSEMSD